MSRVSCRYVNAWALDGIAPLLAASVKAAIGDADPGDSLSLQMGNSAAPSLFGNVHLSYLRRVSRPVCLDYTLVIQDCMGESLEMCSD